MTVYEAILNNNEYLEDARKVAEYLNREYIFYINDKEVDVRAF